MEVENKVEAIIILEHYYEGGDCVGIFDYNKLPSIVKDKVDGYYKLGVYEEMTSNPDENGLQYLFHTKQPRVEIGDEVLFKGIVEFHEKY